MDIGVNKSKSSYIKPISENLFDRFAKVPNMMFYEDGISLETQRKFEIQYDAATGRVIIPHWDLKGNLIGAMGRINGKVEEGVAKYLPVVQSFPKAKTLYGYWQNYNSIQKAGKVVIGESEKFVMQLDSMGIEVGLGLGGSSLSQIQIDNINALQTDKIILAYDEGVDEEIIIENAKKLILDNPFITNKVGYIYDRKNKYLPKGSKMSPTDLGKETYSKLMNECITWVN